MVGSILLVGGDGADLVRTAQVLAPIAETQIVSAPDALGALVRLDPDVIVADEGNGQSSGLRILTEAAAIRPAAVRILLARRADLALNGNEVALLPKPVDPYLVKGICMVALRCAAAQRSARELEHENRRLRGIDAERDGALHELGDFDRYQEMLAWSPRMKRVLDLLRKLEETETSVLIQGETGTGKELAAEAIHARSRRSRGPFVAVNLGAISDPLRESELFGHIRGAFTGATEIRGGLFVEANGGTIFLDEVGDASPGLQVALLRVLEEGTITPVGSDRPRRVDVRVISGTNRDLAELVSQGIFRRDLYYRLHVFPIELPPLRERREDIFPLATHFLELASIAMGRKTPGISREARAVLEACAWEGNVRELRNAMERAAILCKSGLVIAADLPVAPYRPGTNGGGAEPAATIAIPAGGAPLSDLEREIFQKTLLLSGGNQSRAARILGLHESTFRFRLQKLGLGSAEPPSPHAQNGTQRTTRD